MLELIDLMELEVIVRQNSESHLLTELATDAWDSKRWISLISAMIPAE